MLVLQRGTADQAYSSDELDAAERAFIQQPGERYYELSQGEVSLVSTMRSRRPHAEIRRYGANLSAAVLALFALGFIAAQGAQRTTLESEGMKEYNVAQAKALLASDEVEVRNSERRLHLIKDKLKGQNAEEAGPLQKGLSKVLLSKAEDYELQADVSAANVAKLQLSKKKVPKLTAQESSIAEEDDKMYARALRRAAEHNTATEDHLKHMHLYLQQYGGKTQLKVGMLKEKKFLSQAKARMQMDRKNVELLLAAQAKPARPATKVFLYPFQRLKFCLACSLASHRNTSACTE